MKGLFSPVSVSDSNQKKDVYLTFLLLYGARGLPIPSGLFCVQLYLKLISSHW